MLKRRQRRGFSLIELLIVIAIILIIITIAVPKYNRTQMYMRETAAIKAIQTIHQMEVQYQSQYGRYATSLAELGPPQSGAARPAAADLIGNDLAEGEKQGYKFTLTGDHGRLRRQRQPGHLRHQRQPDLLFGPDHGDPRELRARAGHGQQQRNGHARRK